MQSLWMLLASLLFALMGVCVKLASSYYTTSEIVMFRGLVGIFFILGIAKYYRVSLKTRIPIGHVSRGVWGALALWLWFYSIGRIPLAMANTLAYMSPIWIAAIMFGLSWWYGKSHFSWKLTSSIVLSFFGVLLLLQPSMQAEQLPVAVVAFISSIFAAMAYLQVRTLGLRGEPETRVVFYFSIMSAVAGVITGWMDQGWSDWHSWNEHQPIGLLLLLGIGFFASTAQLAMTRAYRIGHPLVTANLSYCGIVFSCVFGILIWEDQLGMVGWLGIGIIVISGMVATYMQTKMTLTNNEPKPT